MLAKTMGLSASRGSVIIVGMRDSSAAAANGSVRSSLAKKVARASADPAGAPESCRFCRSGLLVLGNSRAFLSLNPKPGWAAAPCAGVLIQSRQAILCSGHFFEAIL